MKKKQSVEINEISKMSCGFCKSVELKKVNELYEGYGKFLDHYKCKKCSKNIYRRIESQERCFGENKDISSRENREVSGKLAAWRQEYLKRRAEPKKYEPMLYFLDYNNGISL